MKGWTSPTRTTITRTTLTTGVAVMPVINPIRALVWPTIEGERHSNCYVQNDSWQHCTVPESHRLHGFSLAGRDLPCKRNTAYCNKDNKLKLPHYSSCNVINISLVMSLCQHGSYYSWPCQPPPPSFSFPLLSFERGPPVSSRYTKKLPAKSYYRPSIQYNTIFVIVAIHPIHS